MQKVIASIIAACSVLSVPGSLSAQCAMCAQSLASAKGPGQPDAAAGFHWGMLFMLGMLFPLAGGLVGFVAYAARGATAEGEAAAQSDDA